MNEQFYLVLSSNSSLNIFQENKTSYKVQLPYPLELEITKWEVALSEIQFPNNFSTIGDGRNRIIKQYLSSSRDDLNYLYNNVEGKGNKEKLDKIENATWKQDYVYQVSIGVLPGIYDDIEQILSQLRNAELKNIRNIDYSYHPITQKVYINLVQNCNLAFNNSDVGYCLGYPLDEVLSAEKTSYFTEYCYVGYLTHLLYLHRYSSKSTCGRCEGSDTQNSSSKRRKIDLCPL